MIGRALLRIGVLALVALAGFSAAKADETDVRVEARVKPERGITVGMRAALEVKISVAAIRFDGAPTVEEPRIAQTIVRRLDQSTLKGTEKADGRDWIYQIWTFDLWPAEAGVIDVPSLDVVVKLPAEDGAEASVVRTRTDALSFEVRVPERGEDADFALAARSFEIEESLDRSLDGLRVGDAVRRTITSRVEDAPGMLIPPTPPPSDQPGLGSYAETPSVEDRFSRGDLTGIRVETVTYVMEQEGSYVLPEIRIPWWNVVEGKLDGTLVERHEITVVANPDLDAEQTARLAREAGGEADDAKRGLGGGLATLGWILGAVVLGILGVRLARRYGPKIEHEIAVRREARQESEDAYFQGFEDACRTNDPKVAHDALRRWLDRAYGPTMTLEAFVERAGDAGLAREVAALQQTLYGQPTGGAWTGGALSALVAKYRDPRRDIDGGDELRLNPAGYESPDAAS